MLSYVPWINRCNVLEPFGSQDSPFSTLYDYGVNSVLSAEGNSGLRSFSFLKTEKQHICATERRKDESIGAGFSEEKKEEERVQKEENGGKKEVRKQVDEKEDLEGYLAESDIAEEKKIEKEWKDGKEEEKELVQAKDVVKEEKEEKQVEEEKKELEDGGKKVTQMKVWKGKRKEVVEKGNEVGQQKEAKKTIIYLPNMDRTLFAQCIGYPLRDRTKKAIAAKSAPKTQTLKKVVEQQKVHRLKQKLKETVEAEKGAQIEVEQKGEKKKNSERTTLFPIVSKKGRIIRVRKERDAYF